MPAHRPAFPPSSPCRRPAPRGRWRAAIGAALLGLAAAAPAAAQAPLPTIALDARLRDDAGIRLGDTIAIAATPDGPARRMVVAAFARRTADPSEVARAEYKVRLHLADLQALLAYGDRVDRFAVVTRDSGATDRVVAGINARAFGFRAHRSRDIAVETGRTFAVINRFHRAIGVITILASAIFLLCIMLLRVEERRREVATLRLIGLSRRTVVRAILVEATAIAVLGAALGTGLGWAVSQVVNRYYQGLYRTPLVFSLVTGEVVALAVALSAGLGVGAGWLAARRVVGRPPLALLGR
ncbi:MAG: ABC transporter permease [Gemmatimonadota bacterium]|jgi:putative ABC transport system permease protein